MVALIPGNQGGAGTVARLDLVYCGGILQPGLLDGEDRRLPCNCGGGGSWRRSRTVAKVSFSLPSPSSILTISRTALNNTLRDAVPLVLQAISASLDPAIESRQVDSALKCLEAWLSYIPARYALSFRQ